jgi:hypothetical protein
MFFKRSKNEMIILFFYTHHQTNKQTNTQYCKTIDKKETQIAYTIPLIAVYSYLLNHGEGILIVRPQY